MTPTRAITLAVLLLLVGCGDNRSADEKFGCTQKQQQQAKTMECP